MVVLVLLIDSLNLGPLLVTLSAPLAVVGYALAIARQHGETLDPMWLMLLYAGVAMATASPHSGPDGRAEPAPG